MTRSAKSPRGPEVAKKVFRANAKAQGLTFRAAAEARKKLQKPKEVAPGMGRRAHGTMTETYWNGREFIHIDHESEDTPGYEICNAEYKRPLYVSGEDGQAPCAPVLASLLDIARPAKAKGIAKEFEMVDSVAKVIAFEDEEEWPVGHGYENEDEIDWDEWGEAYEEWSPKKASYSAVVEGKDLSEL
ncbi:hypothetical protein D9615_009431 [Tricholomella constricta]|uniref:Uncharacterized protein n=1 Tax=Tricholomella constricta TaxID=117010 RepID=A0A8H5LXZ7_9AGAR|nr:hypothetical protein D9615_009431 [Tricholomella constricta]